MKKTVKQALSFLLTLCLTFTLMPISASAASTYNAEKALLYAASHWNDGKGLCAEFVSDCLNAGGLSSWHVECTALYNQLVKEVVNGSKIASVQYLKTSGNNIKTSDNKGKISKGDVIFWRCPNCPSDDVGGDIQHTALISDVSGTDVKVYQHNNPMNNQVTVVGKCYCCLRRYSQIIVIHFGESASSTLKVNSHFNCDVTIQTTKGTQVNLYKNPTDSSRNDYYDRGGDLHSTYGAKLSDGSTWYRVRMNQSGNEVDLWLNAKSSGVKKIIDNVIDPSISFSPSSLSLDVGASKTVSINFKGDNVHRIGGNIEGKSLCDASWGNTDWNKGTTSLIVTGKNVGTATITVNLMDENNKVLYSKSFSITINNKTYTVSYNANGGSGAPSSQTKQYNKPLTLSSVKPVRSGYVFKGWSTSSSSSSVSYQPGGTYTGNSNLSLYAVWERKPDEPSISISPSSLLFSPGDSKTVSINIKPTEGYSISREIGDDSICSASFGSSGSWSFSGDESVSIPLTVTGKSVGSTQITINLKKNIDGTYYSKSFNVTVTSQTYTVSYNANGGSGAPSPQTKTQGKSLTLSSQEPTRSGYTFKGWSTSAGSSSIAYQPGSSYYSDKNVTLYAVWEQNKAESSITFSSNSVTLNPGESKTISASFKGDGIAGIYFDEGNQSICTAKWSGNTDWNKGTTAITLTAHAPGKTTVSLGFKDEAGNEYFYRSIDVTVTASTYSVSYNANGGSGAPSSQTKMHDKSLTLSSQQPTRSGYQFMGWATSAEASGVQYQPSEIYTNNQNLTLYAVWKKNGVGPSIVFSPDHIFLKPGESKVVSFNVQCDSNVSLGFDSGNDVCDLVWENIISEDGTSHVKITGKRPGTITVPVHLVDEDGNFFFSNRFTVTVSGDTYTIYYDPNGGDVQLSSTTVTNGSNYSSLPTPVREGYTFEGWYTSRNGGIRITADTTVDLTEDQTLYAHWAKKDNIASSGSLQNFSARNVYSNGLFRDVTGDAWYFNNVVAVYRLGLMNGVGENTFAPQSNVTIAQAVTLAARLHSIYYTGEDDFGAYDGGKWYDPYVNYARNNGIISENYNFDVPATRELFAHILAQALPADVLQAIRNETIQFADAGSIVYAGDINLLCKAGVITGVTVDGKTYFYPENTITRAEASAIVTRMVRPELRVA